jgi:hypothetical protein
MTGSAQQDRGRAGQNGRIDSLAVTLAVDADAAARFAAQCAEHGGVPHVVLFRAVPAALEERVRVDLVHIGGSPFPVGVAGVLPLPNGTAIGLVSPELVRRHRELQREWLDHLDDRDRRPLRPHVVVQRDVPPAVARATTNVLRRSFRPHQIRAEGWVLWQTSGDEWTELARVPFA